MAAVNSVVQWGKLNIKQQGISIVSRLFSLPLSLTAAVVARFVANLLQNLKDRLNSRLLAIHFSQFLL